MTTAISDLCISIVILGVLILMHGLTILYLSNRISKLQLRVFILEQERDREEVRL